MQHRERKPHSQSGKFSKGHQGQTDATGEIPALLLMNSNWYQSNTGVHCVGMPNQFALHFLQHLRVGNGERVTT